MKRLIQIIALLLIGFGILVAIELYPKLKNMSSEYGTAEAIRDIETYLQENEGLWPDSPEKLGGKYPLDGDVLIDYSVQSNDLIENPDKLNEAVRPRSGKFLTYPHYEWQLEGLLIVLRETSKSEQATAPDG